MSQPLLSVVVPFRDAESSIEPCLDSIVAQAVDGLEVICVDDGSLDESPVIVKSWAAADARFTLVAQSALGRAAAREAGAARASGRYLAFVDGEDIVPPGAYAPMLAALEETGSDLACGVVVRATGDRLTRSPALREAFRSAMPRTHISRHPALVHDRFLGNKVFRRVFWDRHALGFGGLEETWPTAIEAHVRARAVDVLPHAVYQRRGRGGPPSPEGLRDLLAAITRTASFLAEHAPDLRARLDAEAMRDDLRLVARALPRLSPTDRVEVLESAQDYLATVPATAWWALPALTRLELRLVERGLIEEITSVLAFQEERREPVRVRPRGTVRRRWYADYPLRDDPRLPPDCHDVTGELTLDAQIDRFTWQAGRLGVAGRVRVPGVRVRDLSGGRLRLALRQAGAHDIPAGEWRIGKSEAGWFGFRIDLTEILAHAPDLRDGLWQLHAEVDARGLGVSATAHAPAVDAVYARGPLRIGDGRWLIPGVGAGRRFKLRVRQARAAITACSFGQGGLTVSGWSIAEPGAGKDAAVIATCRGEEERVLSFPASLRETSRGVLRFEAVVPIHAIGCPGGSGWRLSLQRPGGAAVPLALDIAYHLGGIAGNRWFVVTRSSQCNVVLRERIEDR